jgi:predicted DNA binding CopG/RHH family protein
VVQGGTFLLSLTLSLWIDLSLFAFQFATVRALKLSYVPEDWLLLYPLPFGVALAWLLFSLQHPHTRALFGLEPTNGSPRTLYLQRRVAAAVTAGALAFAVLLGGGHLLRNPFERVAQAVLRDDAVSARVGAARELRLHQASVFNWTFASTWTVVGTRGEERYEIRVGPGGDVGVSPPTPRQQPAVPPNKSMNMKKEYDLKKLKKRPGKFKIDNDAVKVPVSVRLDGSVLAAIKTEAERLEIPYQTLIGSILHRYASE